MASDADAAELTKWVEQLFEQVRQLRINQHIWEEVQKIIAANPAIQKPSHFYAWMRDMYVSGIAMAIRRLVDDDSRTMSFLRFLKRLKGDPSVVSRARYRSLYKPNDVVVEEVRNPAFLQSYIDRTYDATVGQGKRQPSCEDIQAEIDELQRLASRFVGFANQVIAHDDKNKPSVLPTFAEVDGVVSYLERLAQKYIQLVAAAHRSVDLSFQYDWKSIFREVWIPSKRARSA